MLDIEMISKSWSLMEVGQLISDHIRKLCTLIILPKKRKKSDNYEGSDSNKNEFFCYEDDMASEGSNGEIDKNESKQEVTHRLKQNEIREKLRIYYDAGISKQKLSQMIFLH